MARTRSAGTLCESDIPVVRPLHQLFRFSRTDTTCASTNETQVKLIAERGLGMPRQAGSI